MFNRTYIDNPANNTFDPSISIQITDTSDVSIFTKSVKSSYIELEKLYEILCGRSTFIGDNLWVYNTLYTFIYNRKT